VADVQYEIPTWNQIYNMLLNQAQKIQESHYKADIIIGIARGGIIPSRILSDLLENSQLVKIQIEFYTNIAQTKAEPTLKQDLTLLVADRNILLVDDISDTGKSNQLAKDYLQELGVNQIKIATLYVKPQSISVPDFFEKLTNNWVVFPWEIKETLRKIIQGQPVKRAQNQELAKLVKAGLPKQIVNKLLDAMR
jgi:uncharacterized protein